VWSRVDDREGLRRGSASSAHPQIDPIGTLIFQTTADSIRHVLVAGRFVKRDGQLVDVDANRLNAQAHDSAERVLNRIKDSGRPLPGTPPGGFAVLKQLIDTEIS
jgi:hypothetical protein